MQYGSTSGPHGGLAGQALTVFQITALEIYGVGVLIYADKAPLGWVAEADASRYLREQFPHVAVDQPGIQPASTCPVPMTT